MSGKLSVVIRCDGDHDIGLGHIYRCLALGEELAERHGCAVMFAVRRGPIGIDILETKGFPVATPPDSGRVFPYREWLEEVLGEADAKVLILDVRDGLTSDMLRCLRDKRVVIVTIDDPEEKRLEANLAFYPPVPQMRKVHWEGFSGELYVDWKYVILRRQFAKKYPRLRNLLPKVMIIMGGSDPAGLTLKAVKVINQIELEMQVSVVIGGGYRHQSALNTLLEECPHPWKLHERPRNLAALMSQHDLAVASFGVTAFELAAVGVPAVYLCLTDDHAASAAAFAEAGMAVSLGVHGEVSDAKLAKAVQTLLKDPVGRRDMADQACARMDGLGAQRVAELLANRLKSAAG